MKLNLTETYLIEEGEDEYKDLENIGVHIAVAIFLPNKKLKITEMENKDVSKKPK